MSTPATEELIYSLTNILSNHKYLLQSPTWDQSSTSYSAQKRLKLLSLLSVLLVTESSNDVVAISLRITSRDSIEISYAKNRPCTLIEKEYVNKLFEIACDRLLSSPARRYSLLSLVVIQCKKKVISCLQNITTRLRQLDPKLDQAFLKVVYYKDEIRNQSLAQCAEEIRVLLSCTSLPPDSSLTDMLKLWFQRLLDHFQPGIPFDMDSEDHTVLVLEAVNIGHYLTRGARIAPILEQNLLGHVEKLGDYYIAVDMLEKEVSKLTVSQLSSLIIREIPTPQPSIGPAPSDFIGILNRWAQCTGQDETTQDAVQIAYPAMSLPPKIDDNNVQMVKSIVHCECSLALAFASTHLSSTIPTTLEIGVSEPICWLSQEFISSFHELYPLMKINIPNSTYHSKLQSIWTLPRHTPSVIANTMRQRTEEGLNYILERSRLQERWPSQLYRTYLDDMDNLSEYIALLRQSGMFGSLHDRN